MSTAQLSDQQVLELGAKLRSARETQGKDLPESAFRIALSPSQLRALESGDLRPFYSTHYFLQAVERYADFLGVTLAELEAYRSNTQSSAVLQPKDPKQTGYAIDDDLPMTSKSQALPRNMNTSGTVASPISLAASSERRRPTAAVLMISAAVLVLSAVVTLKDSAPPSAPITAAAEAPAAPAAPLQAIEPAAATEASKPAMPDTAPPPQPPIAATAATTAKPTVAIGDKDGRIESSVNGWVQIVRKSGEKSNLRISAGESIEFASGETAAVVIGQPEKATLTVRGRAVDLRQYASSKDGSSRALVIIGDIRN